MLLIEKKKLQNGAHDNQIINYLQETPEGWIVVPQSLEEKAIGYLPFIDLILNGDELIDVKQGEIPSNEPTPPHTYTELELAQQSITDLDLELIQMGQEMTDMELTMYEMVKISGGGAL